MSAAALGGRSKLIAMDEDVEEHSGDTESKSSPPTVKTVKTTHDFLQDNPCLPRRRFQMFEQFKDKPHSEWYNCVQDARDLPACKGCKHALEPGQPIFYKAEGFAHGDFVGPGYWFCLPVCVKTLLVKQHGVQSASQLTWFNKMAREYWGCAPNIPVFDEDNFVKNGGSWTYAQYRKWAIDVCWPRPPACATAGTGRQEVRQIPPMLRSVPFVAHAVVLEDAYRAPVALATDLVRQDRVNLETTKLKDKQAKKQASEEKKKVTQKQRAEVKRVKDEIKKKAKADAAMIAAALRAEKERKAKEVADAKAAHKSAQDAADSEGYMPARDAHDGATHHRGPPPPLDAPSAASATIVTPAGPRFDAPQQRHQAMDTSTDDAPVSAGGGTTDGAPDSKPKKSKASKKSKVAALTDSSLAGTQPPTGTSAWTSTMSLS
jgi:hypothetical protein